MALVSARAVGKVACARIVAPVHPDFFGSTLLRHVLRTGEPNERYGRVWRMSKIEEGSGCLHGRLGFERAADQNLWDEAEQDFRRTAVQNGFVSPFVIRLTDLAVVFQPRKQELRVASFVGALRSILRTRNANPAEVWDVESLTGQVSFEDWRRTIEHVTHFRYRIDLGTQQSPPAMELTRLVAATQPDVTTLDLRAKDGIDSDSPLVREILRHAGDGFGDVRAVGRCAGAVSAERVWESALGGEVTVTEVSADPTTGEVSRASLLAQLSAIPPVDR
ncbi:hypothetical protein GCM10027290_41980 [Micromonospora sonneratiae]